MNKTDYIQNILTNYPVTLEHIINNESDTPLINIPIFIISLRKNECRREFMRVMMKTKNLNFTFVIVEPISKETYDYMHRNINSIMTLGEMGCTLSHLYCLQRAHHFTDKNKIIVCEDDIILSKQFLQQMEQIKHIERYSPIPISMLHLGCCDFYHHYQKNNQPISLDTLIIYKAKKNIQGFYSIMYDLSFIPTFVEYKINQFAPIDENNELLYKNHSIYVCNPNIVVAELSSSDLNHHFSFVNANVNANVDIDIDKCKLVEASYYKSCFTNFNFQDYHFMYIDLFAKVMEDKNSLDIISLIEENYGENAEIIIRRIDLELL